jgi:hypothetical protein
MIARGVCVELDGVVLAVSQTARHVIGGKAALLAALNAAARMIAQAADLELRKFNSATNNNSKANNKAN